MWAVLIRLGSRYAFFRRWKSIITFGSIALLCAIAAILIDAKMYLSAGVIGFVGLTALALIVTQFFRQRQYEKDRERRKLEQVAQRAVAAQIRSERVDKAKATFADAATSSAASVAGMARTGAAGAAATFAGAAKSATSGAASVADLAKTGISGARDRLGSWRKKD
jgi:hypothetical protein